MKVNDKADWYKFHVAEITAVLADANLGEKPIIVGHSFGGFMTMRHGKDHGGDLTGAVIIDSPRARKTGPRERDAGTITRPSDRPTGSSRTRRK